MSRWTFANVSFSDPAEPNEASPAMQITAITEGSVAPSAPFAIRLYWYHPDAEVVNNQPQGEDATAFNTGYGTESITETVSLQWGKGTASFPDTTGNTNVYDPFQKAEPVGYKEVTYSVNYREYNLSSPTLGEHEGVFLFSDGSNITSQKFTVEDAPDDAGACLADGGQWVDGECVYPDDPEYPEDPIPYDPGQVWMQAENLTGAVIEGALCRIRVWFFHPDPGFYADPLGKMEAYYPGLTHTIAVWNPAIDYSVTETVQLKWGVGNTSKTDTNGNTLVDVPADYSKPFSETSVTYAVCYRDFDLYSATDGEYPCAFWFSDHSAEATASVTVTDPEPDPPDPPEPVYRTVTLEIYNHQTEAIVAGADVYVDGDFLGVTDENGQITTGLLEVGTTHTLQVIADDYIDSDLDDIANDSFIVPEVG